MTYEWAKRNLNTSTHFSWYYSGILWSSLKIPKVTWIHFRMDLVSNVTTASKILAWIFFFGNKRFCITQTYKHCLQEHFLYNSFLKITIRSTQKSQTYEEGAAHLRISFWHLLMNFKNNYLLKKLLKWANNVPQITIIWCMIFEIWGSTDRIFCRFRPCFLLLPHLQPKKSTFWKNEKSAWRYHHFKQEYKNHDHILYIIFI